MGHDLVEEVGGSAPLALQAPLHVGHRDQDGVDGAAVDQGAEIGEGER